jgi:hypothetical protein
VISEQAVADLLDARAVQVQLRTPLRLGDLSSRPCADRFGLVIRRASVTQRARPFVRRRGPRSSCHRPALGAASSACGANHRRCLPFVPLGGAAPPADACRSVADIGRRCLGVVQDRHQFCRYAGKPVNERSSGRRALPPLPLRARQGYRLPLVPLRAAPAAAVVRTRPHVGRDGPRATEVGEELGCYVWVLIQERATCSRRPPRLAGPFSTALRAAALVGAGAAVRSRLPLAVSRGAAPPALPLRAGSEV